MRCPKCGNDVNKDDFVCVYCGARLREEAIESIKLFRRLDEKWIKPEPRWRRMILAVTNPSRSFWDITHYREKTGGTLVYFLTCIAFGFIGLAIMSHINLSVIYYVKWLYDWAVFFAFFLFGLIYYALFFTFAKWLYKKGANYSIGLANQLKIRYGEGKDKDKDKYEEKAEKTRAQLEAEGEYILELPDYLTSQKSKTGKIMNFAMLPITIGLLISALVIWIGLPSITLPTVFDWANPPAQTSVLWASAVWGITDWIQVIILIGWVPITMSIALRDIANASTMKVYLSCLVISVILGVLFYFMRPTLIFANVV